MKNIHIILTPKPSRLVLETVNNYLFLTTTTEFPSKILKFQHIYITSDEEIKEGDYIFNLASKEVYPILELWAVVSYEKKIILTTDQDLIADGIQAIDDEFLEWFVKNPSCEKVEVIYLGKFNKVDAYKIIIPQEEPKFVTVDIESALGEDLGKVSYIPLSGVDYVPKEEPKQEKDLAYWKENAEEDYMKVPISVLRYITELEERMYSEEDMKQFAEWLIKVNFNYTSNISDVFLIWNKQFKKK
jgi:hypothetical protein